jgi:hypothetical protein
VGVDLEEGRLEQRRVCYGLALLWGPEDAEDCGTCDAVVVATADGEALQAHAVKVLTHLTETQLAPNP